MKELEKTKQVSVAAVLTILVVIIGLLSYKKPKHLYKENVETTLTNLIASDYIISKSNIDANTYLIDVRSNFEFVKGHLDNAINISLPDLLLDENVEIIENARINGKVVTFYSEDINEALSAHMIIEQLGYAKTKVLAISISYNQDKLVVHDLNIERSPEDIQAFIDKSVQEVAAKKIVEVKPVAKKVIPKKKKKKMPVEGGC